MWPEFEDPFEKRHHVMFNVRMKMTLQSQPALTIDTAPPAGLLCHYSFSKNLLW